jgi:hypothetical protein
MDLHAIADRHGVRLVDLEVELPPDGPLRRRAMPFLRRASQTLRKLAKRRTGMSRAFLFQMAMRLEDVPSNDETLEYHPNSASLAGSVSPEIVLGPFQDAHCRVAAFFHELGHLEHHRSANFRHADTLKYDDEFTAWVHGIELAEIEGVRFDDKTLAWCDEQLASYIGWEQREVRGWADVEPPRDPNVLVKAYGRESGWAPAQRSQG